MASACQASFPASPDPVPTSLEFHHQIATGPYRPGMSFGYTVYAVYIDGGWEDVTHRGVTWASSNDGVIRVRNGVTSPLTAVAPGAADITASYAGFTDSIHIEVHPGCCTYPEMRIQLRLGPHAGSSVNASAFLVESASLSTNVTSLATWMSSNAAVASVEAGRISGHLPGTAEITASYNGVTGWIRLSVPPLR